MKRTLKAKRVHNTQDIKLEEILLEIVENRLEDNLDALYNQHQADTVIHENKVQNDERWVA